MIERYPLPLSTFIAPDPRHFHSPGQSKPVFTLPETPKISRHRSSSSPIANSRQYDSNHSAIKSRLSPNKFRLKPPQDISLKRGVGDRIQSFYTPYPRQITPELMSSNKDKNMKLDSNTTDQIQPDYFEQYYHVVGSIGKGEFAEAFKVICKKDGLVYAIKRTTKPFQGYKDRIAKLEEVEIMWKLEKADHCVRLYGAWEQFGHLYMQLELCNGGNLETFIENATKVLPLEEYQIISILKQIATGLAEIHSQGIVHLDIKPGNIFIQNEQLKIGDYGQASFAPVSEGRDGDRTYMAPELLNETHLTSQADIFSLGMLILEIVANVDLPENGDVWFGLRNGRFEGVDFGRCSADLQKLVKAMMESDRDKRPSAIHVLFILEHGF